MGIDGYTHICKINILKNNHLIRQSHKDTKKQ